MYAIQSSSAVVDEVDRMRRHLRARDALNAEITGIIESGNMSTLRTAQQRRDYEDAQVITCARVLCTLVPEVSP